MRCFVWLTLAACNQLFGLEPTKPVDAPPSIDARPDAPGCSGSTFAGAQTIDLDGFAGDPSTFEDPNEIWFTHQATGGYVLQYATRASESAPFGTPTTFSPMVGDTDAALSADGLVLVFQSDRLGYVHVFESKRTSRTAPWSAPVQIVAAGMVGNGIDLSFDGNTLYYLNGDALYTAQRASRDDAWVARPELLASGITWPSVSGDGLELYYANNGTVARRVRTATIAAFGPEEAVTSGSDPEITTDSRHLYMLAGGLVMLSRSCN